MKLLHCACGRVALLAIGAAAVMLPGRHAFTTTLTSLTSFPLTGSSRGGGRVRTRNVWCGGGGGDGDAKGARQRLLMGGEGEGEDSIASFPASEVAEGGGEVGRCCDKHDHGAAMRSGDVSTEGQATDGLTLQQRIALQMGKTVESPEETARRAAQAAMEVQREKTRNIGVAVASFLSTAMVFFFTHSALSPANANPIGLLRAMESSSTPLMTALTNGKPTVVDFYASWCENCKTMAPVMKAIEAKYDGKVNFVVVDGDSPANEELVGAFRVDGIPHLAMISRGGDVQTAIIGTVPRKVIEEDINALLKGEKELPFIGYDAFEGEDHNVLAGMGLTEVQ